jgi:hypothetical protein
MWKTSGFLRNMIYKWWFSHIYASLLEGNVYKCTIYFIYILTQVGYINGINPVFV